ncbi:tRNA uracil 4-sulfurtransferase ThiI [Fredinandcohnia quinoae]|uniref:Probable tRNA sulfurtransferase n=1 Tax=Fredinandcohnia quinoae TaxID=2918902 RepID=A0AAW5E7W6_9BACI|nr:tRNA uracil 4-sulfurtransferase ThiI [Fredinandcohnia sp. SECRCQ15]MCH1627584.1 tRNA 4-thiouridine(8) synthase ThiI [Fredinandcohnia sp. SECRCQ15]
MEYDRILIRFGEISTKGRNRHQFIEQLRKNIQTKLSDYKKITIHKTRDRIYLKLNGESHEEIINGLKGIFGIQSFSLAMKVESEINLIKAGALAAYQQLENKGITFKISAKRSDKTFPLNTNELNYELGSHLLKNIEGLKVDVHNPDVNIKVEVRKGVTYITCKDIPGAGGLPVGISGKAMLMLSGGLDSPVAGFLSMKRGLEIEAVHFYSPPYTSERSRQKVVDLAQELTEFSGSIKLHIVPFTEIQQVIQQQIPENYTLISTRRLMLKIADEIRKLNNGLAIATGESLGQVASQTLESMFVINEVTSTPMIRPLISTDKTEIIEIARKINTYDISIRPFEDCCTIFTPASPKTKPKLDRVKYYESFTDFEGLIADAIKNTEVLYLNHTGQYVDDDNLF